MYARYIPPSKGQEVSKEPVTIPPAPAPVPELPRDGFSYSRFIPGAKSAAKPVEVPSIIHFGDEPNSPIPKRKRDDAELPGEQRQPDSKKSKRPSAQEAEAPLASKKSKKDKKKSKENGIVPMDVDEPSSQPTADAEKDEVTDSKKDRKDKKKKKQKDTEDTAEPELENEDIPMADAEPPVNGDKSVLPAEADTATEKKKRKEKKKKPSDPVPVDIAPKDDKDDPRHKSVLERKVKSLKLATETAHDIGDAESLVDEGELHGLEPLPQPEPTAADTSKPAYETLPSWMAAPIRVSQDTRTPFTDLGLIPKAARALEEKGFKDAFAVQTAAIPLLLPSSKHRTGDLLISAATGSGKTLAYALPIVRDISQGVVTRLRALVVLPTRELVKQAQEVFELCAKAYEGGDRKRVRIGIAIGSQMLRHEQEHLVESETRYNPEVYKKLQEQRRMKRISDGLDEIDLDADDVDERLGTWEGEVVDFMSKVDVLICTPGRLVEHVEQTAGFDLDYVRWLVVDEADKLLAQSFQGWLEIILEKFQTNKFSARDFPDMDYSGVRKVVLSATLTRDLSLLGQLALRRPQLIVLEGDGDVQVAEHSLPGLLKEFAIRVHDANLKPLYLLDLLQGQHMISQTPKSALEISKEADGASESDSSSDASDSDPTSSSDSDSDTDSDSNSESKPPSRPTQRTSQLPIALIFTKSNESALRLSRLLTLLDKSMETQISTLTSTTPTHIRRKTLRAFTEPSSPVRLIIASDLVARGIDIPKLDHVVNYDLPPSVAGYVHRVGRTARAGRPGCAWTLVGDDESGWFWGKIAKGKGVRRAQKVERTRIEEMGEEQVQDYEAALEKLGKEAMESRRR